MHTDHHIIYLPGYGGHFLENLFSLDTKTKPHIPSFITNPDTTLKGRFDVYDFNNSLKYKNWAEFHVNYNQQHKFDDYELHIFAVHPYEFFYGSGPAPDNPKYYLADLSYDNFSNFWLLEFKKQKHFLSIRPSEILITQHLQNTLNLQIISIDKFLNPDLWEQEYIRIAELMGIDLNLKYATMLYNSWYNIRVKPFKEQFKLLDQTKMSLYYQERQLYEKIGLIYSNQFKKKLTELVDN